MTQPAPAEPRTETLDQPRREIRQETIFRPVALPALAAAIQAVRTPPRASRPTEPPAVLRKEAALG